MIIINFGRWSRAYGKRYMRTRIYSLVMLKIYKKIPVLCRYLQGKAWTPFVKIEKFRGGELQGFKNYSLYGYNG